MIAEYPTRLIIERIKFLCEEQQLTYYKLAQLAEMNANTIHCIINEHNDDVRLLTIKKLCNGFNISLREFFDDDLFN